MPVRYFVNDLSDQDALAVYAIVYWDRHYRDAKVHYDFGNDRFISTEAEARIAKALPGYKKEGSDEIISSASADIIIREIVIDEPFAAVEISESDLIGFIVRYGLVFRKDNGRWQYLGTQNVIAEHSARASLGTYDWVGFLGDLAAAYELVETQPR